MQNFLYQAEVQAFDGSGLPFRKVKQTVPQTLGMGEVLVKIALATICGSDLHTISGHRTERTPCILGHEAVGIVAALGGGRKDLSIGDRVTWSLADSCGRCVYCVQYHMPEKCVSVFKYGHAPLSDGTGLNGCYASHLVLRAGTHIVKVPNVLPNAIVAPANCALATMVNALSHVPFLAQNVLIQGAGMLGLYGCVLLRERGVAHVFCVDINPTRLLQVGRFGGIAVDGRKDFNTEIRHQIEAVCPNGVDAVVEVAGVSALVTEGVSILRTGGVYVFVGMVHPNTPLQITGEQMIRKCLTLRGVHNYSPRHLDEAMAFLERTYTQYPYEDLVSPPFALNDLMTAVEVAQKQTYGRVAVVPETIVE